MTVINKTVYLNLNLNTTQLLALSLEGLHLRLWANCLIIAAGLIAIISNTFLISTIFKTKSLHSKCFFLIGANGFVDLILGASYVFTSGKRIYRYLWSIGEVMSQWECFCEVPMNVFCQIMSLAMAATLVIERSIAITSPIKYKQLNFKHLTIPLLVAAFLYSLIQFLANLIDSYTGQSVIIFSCGVDDTVSNGMLIGLLVIQIATSVAVVALNCILAIVIKWKHNKIQDVANIGAREEKVFKTITLTVFIHIFIYLGGRLGILIGNMYLGDLEEAITNRYIRDLVVFGAAANCFVLFGTSSEFRAAAKKMIGFKGNTVSPVVLELQ